MKRTLEFLALILSGCGFPLTQLAIQEWGPNGARLAEVACAVLMVRDAVLIRSARPRRLRTFAKVLLWLELGSGLAATAAGLPLIFLGRARAAPLCTRAHVAELTRRVAVGMLFGIHTWRYGIHLRDRWTGSQFEA